MTQGKTLSVQMLQKSVEIPFKCQVRRVASTGRSSHHDKTMREWYDGKGVRQEPVADYALADVHKNVAHYKEYIRASVLGTNCLPVIGKVVEGCGTAIVGDVYKRAWDYFCHFPNAKETRHSFYQPWPPGKTNQGRKTAIANSVSEEQFLLGLFELRFALSKLPRYSSPPYLPHHAFFLLFFFFCFLTLPQGMLWAGLGSWKKASHPQSWPNISGDFNSRR